MTDPTHLPAEPEPATEGYDPYADGCDRCGGEDHTCDTCPEFTSLADYEAHVAEDHR